MTNEPSTPTGATNRPVAYLYYSKPSQKRNSKDRLIRIGAVFAHQSGKGRTHIIDVLPIDREWDGRIVELEPKDDTDEA